MRVAAARRGAEGWGEVEVGRPCSRDRSVVRRFRRLLEKRRVPVWRCLLFGSRARGDAEPASDYDVLVVVDGVGREFEGAVLDCAWEIGFEAGAVLVPVTVSRQQYESGPFSASLLMDAVRAEGVPL